MKTAWFGSVLSLSISLSLVASEANAQASLVAPEDLKGVLPQSLENYTLRESLAAGSTQSAMSEAAVAYFQRDPGVNIRIHIADLVNNPEMYDRFVATAGIVQAEVSRVAEQLVQRAGDGTIEKVVSDWGDQTLADLGIEKPSVQPVGSRALRFVNVNPTLTPRELIDQWSVFGPGQLVERFGDVPFNRLASISGVALALEHEAYGLGVDFSGTALRANESGRYFFLNPDSVGQFAVGLTEEKYPDGAYARLFRESKADVAGWELFQPEDRYGVLLLGVGGRFGVLVEGVGINDTTPLRDAFAAVAVDQLVKLTK